MIAGRKSLLLAAAACGALWMSTFFGFWSSAGWTVNLLRVVATALVFVAGVSLWDGRRRLLLLSPLLHMALLTLLFYGWMPLIAEMLIHADAPGSGAVENFKSTITAYTGSRSEVFILGAVILCIGVLLYGASFSKRSAALGSPKFEPAPRALGWIAAAGIVVLAASVVAVRLSPGLTAFTNAGIGRQILQATPPLLSFAVACLVFAWADAGRAKIWLGAILVLGGAVSLIAENRAPVSLFVIYGAIMLFLVRAHVQWRRAIVLVASGAAVLFGILAFLVFIRPPSPGTPIGSQAQLTVRFVTSKLFFRQAISAGCYNIVAEKGLDRGSAGNSLYFMSALVLRVLWPEKPNLSKGDVYAEMCGQNSAIENRQSESITLLGEPILEAGLIGLVVAEITLVGLLLIATLVALTRGAVATITVVSLFPWLINIEQHFALYVGNLFKMGLVILPFALVLNWLWPRLANSFGSGGAEPRNQVATSAPGERGLQRSSLGES